MQFIRPDHRLGIDIAVECVGELIAERHEAEIVLQVCAEKLAQEPAEPGAARALLSVARRLLADGDTLDELRGCITHLQSEFALREVSA